MYDLKVDGKTVSTHTTLDDAFKARNAKVREICQELYDDNTIDKYAMQDWCFDLDNNKNMTFYLNEGCGYSIDIVEVKNTKTAPKKARKTTVKQTAQNEVWTVAWAEFDGWNSELYTGSQLFKSKDDAIAWVENDYNQTLEEKFGQDPDDDHKPLKLNKKKIDGLDNKIDFPECENTYRKWTINKSTL